MAPPRLGHAGLGSSARPGHLTNGQLPNQLDLEVIIVTLSLFKRPYLFTPLPQLSCTTSLKTRRKRRRRLFTSLAVASPSPQFLHQ